MPRLDRAGLAQREMAAFSSSGSGVAGCFVASLSGDTLSAGAPLRDLQEAVAHPFVALLLVCPCQTRSTLCHREP